MQAQGVIIGKFIELLHETNLPDGLPVTLEIRTKPVSVEKKRELVDELCGSWADDQSLNPIFAEIAKRRSDSQPRKADFDASS